MAVIIGLVKVTAALMGVDSHTPMAVLMVCSNSPKIRHRMNLFLFFLLSHTDAPPLMQDMYVCARKQKHKS